MTSIGRQEGSALAINHSSISRRHAEIAYAHGQYLLRDLKSTNGTFVNDQRLEPEGICLLKQGDKVRFGKVTFALQMRHVDPSSSVLLRRPVVGAPPAADQSPVEAVAWELITHRNDEEELAARNVNEETVQIKLDGASLSGVQAPLGQPVLKADGSLQLPGASSAIPADVVARMKQVPTLVVVMRGEPEIVLLKQGQCYVLGRDKRSRILLPDVSVSRKHAEVFPGLDGYYIRDLASSNGVMVNQTRIDNPYRLSNSDRIMVGNVPLYFISLDDHVIPSAPPIAESPADARSAKICRSCGAENIVVARFCAICGVPLK